MPSIALAAPTGKAAARLEASIQDAKADLETDAQIKEIIPAECHTTHQLLGARRHTAHFRHNEDNPLPYDYIIIDEVSMVDQALMSRLMDATLTKTRLLLLGDKDQLSSVEAGSVLGDLCGDRSQNYFSSTMKNRLEELNINLPESSLTESESSLVDHIILLQKSYRFDAESGIGQLALAVNKGEPNTAWDILTGGKNPEVSIDLSEEYEQLLKSICEPSIQQFRKAQAESAPAEMLEIYSRFKILAAHRTGPWGVQAINSRVERSLRKGELISPYEQWYAGRPVIINANDYTLGLSNGDLGVCAKDSSGSLKVFFDSDEGITAISPARLPDHSTAYALTVHKSQGSEFDKVSFVLPHEASKILSRELVYTAISRARKSVMIYGNKSVFFKAVERTAARTSGLKDHFWS